MSLQQQLPQGGLRVRWVAADAITVEQREWRQTFALSPADTWTADEANGDPLNWSIENWNALLVALRPQILLVGSGERQRFLPAPILAHMLSRGIGVECMDNHAAARTFNLLADEDRQVAVVFTLASG